MDGIERAAILLLSMGEKNASEVLKHLEPRQVQKVGMAMSTMNSVSKAKMQNVLIDFISAIEDQTSLTVDTEHYLRTVLIEALGEEKANPFIDRILVSNKDSGLNKLKWLDGRLIAEVIRNEHPQIIATILIHLDSEQSAEVVSYFSAEKRAEVLLRMCNIDTVKPEAISELGHVIEKQLSGQTTGKSSSVGGIKTVADVINFLDGAMEEEVLERIKDWDEELSEKIRDKMFVFENIKDMDDRSVQTLLREVTSDQLKLALKGTTETTKEKIYSNMSKRAADLLRDDIEVQGPVRVSDVERAQRDILAIARNLAEDGKISLGAKGGDELI
ncbi:TPA: flagellar motor switch protein FliG [Legionella pneumophila]|jgi:flagellar motor switch protein FliG|uniref:Flagellar motor switch protein FliG n=1 Tax=Legionella pneumophila TaxID=446 RepID=A0A2S6EYD6_LEGPN|nr:MULTISPECIES: flagellar motor switch protein FliG [Legionella]APF03386.1 flagellar motor switch protein FliG [Legionella pneumophila subsp. fraseri]APF06414.1 flagellar motor switch protein FliG [Legionella pneumophila subsp. fraseri]AUB68870.1 flagellar motor switch protein FliG [Legionella pneumophila]AUB71843.1 flagellar motor switch protein FliG [Legionella pneumophila]KXB26186.1 flagellar motor switch protein FliG [Legionella pneumophila]